MKPLALRRTGPPPLQVRQEIFSLGGRHRGDALAGAHTELKDQSLTAERRALLRSVVSHLSGDTAVSDPGDTARTPGKRVTLADAVYLGVILATAVWGAFVFSARLG